MEQLKSIPNKIIVNQYTIYFSYDTHKGNYREQQRVINALSEDNARTVFNTWIRTKQFKNVEVLGILKAAKKSFVVNL